MRRSQINRLIKEAEIFFEKQGFKLPPFAFWNPDNWRDNIGQIDEILECELGWDITDFGKGDFLKEGLLLFTIRNGKIGDTRYPKPYAEKIMITREEQITLLHYHRKKTEDIINRGGGNLIFELYNSTQNGKLSDSPVMLQQDGVLKEIPAGGLLRLTPGESVTLTPGVFHQFWGEKNTGDVLVGEVSSVNDDHNDNIFYHDQLRFPTIDEDEKPLRLMVGDYATTLANIEGNNDTD